MSKLSKGFHTSIDVEDDLSYADLIDWQPEDKVKLQLTGYRTDGKPYTFTTLGPVKDIVVIICEDISGDEVVTIVYNDRTIEKHDGSDCRTMSFHDGSYFCISDAEIRSFIDEHVVGLG